MKPSSHSTHTGREREIEIAEENMKWDNDNENGDETRKSLIWYCKHIDFCGYFHL